MDEIRKKDESSHRHRIYLAYIATAALELDSGTATAHTKE
jgi:hypothetical protein